MQIPLFKVLCIIISLIAIARTTPLDDYVNKPDPSYKWSVEGVYRGAGFTGYAIKLTSQTWLSANEVDKYVWEHWLNVCVPDNVKGNSGVVYIDGGSNPLGAPPTKMNPAVELVCVSSQSVSAHLAQVPNQPLYFTDDPKRRTEDSLIAFTWTRFMNDTSNPEWLARLPMTKAVVRAMDTVQAFVKTLDRVPPVHDFLIAGASKRGWTAWTTAAVDKRVKIVVPIVMPIVGMRDIIDEMYRVYGEWSFVLQDYINERSLQYFGKPEFEEMAAIIDPKTYIHRLTMIKYVIVASGDEFFLPDSTKHFWSKLSGPSYLRVLPNAEHSTIGSSISSILSAETLLQKQKDRGTLPKLDFRLTYSNTTAKISARVMGSYKPYVVKKWWATTLSTTQRDFRLLTCLDGPHCINPVFWQSEILEESSPNTYEAYHKRPEEGWTGFFIEVTFRLEDKLTSILNPTQEFKITTSTNVVPDILPFDSCLKDDVCQPDIDSVHIMKDIY